MAIKYSQGRIEFRIEKVPLSLGFWHPIALISTWFGAGLLRPASGTWGSLFALPAAWLICNYLGGITSLLVAIILFFALGLWASGTYALATNSNDPSSVVIDEVVGQWLALSFVPILTSNWHSWGWWLLAFVLFRVFDIIKPFPANWIEKHIPGGWGIMLDDLVAGVYAGLVSYGIWVMSQ